jgi:hypothetical protein
MRVTGWEKGKKIFWKCVSDNWQGVVTNDQQQHECGNLQYNSAWRDFDQLEKWQDRMKKFWKCLPIQLPTQCPIQLQSMWLLYWYPGRLPNQCLSHELFSGMVVCKLTCRHDETLTNTSNGGTKRRNFEVSPNPILPKSTPDPTPCIDVRTDSRTNALSTTFFISRSMGIYNSARWDFDGHEQWRERREKKI